MIQTPPSLSKSAQLRMLLHSPQLEHLMEAHNGLSARIVEEAGFKAIWGSGLAISAQLGVRDNNEASWSQVVDVLEFMSDATGIPILLDGDTGYGNFNNMRRLVRKLEQRGVAGVCIEDKVYPKTNSFIGGGRQPLCDTEEFCGKLAAGKDSQSDADFSIVARVEALVAGWGLEEALERAEAYRRAGADAILIHSTRARPDEVLAFAERWQGRAPLIVVPTKYFSTPTQVFRDAGIGAAIWANHLVRAAARAMQSAAGAVRAAEGVADIEDHIASIEEIFRLQGAHELAAAERRYAQPSRADTRAVILAATRGEGMDSVTHDRPKVMVPVAGQSLLQRLVDAFKREGVHDLTVVAGYQAQAIDVGGIRIVDNPEHMRSGELASLACARDALGADTVITYGDLLFRRYILRELLDSMAELTAVVDSALPVAASRDYRDLAYCSRPDDHALFQEAVELRHVRARAEPHDAVPEGRLIGMLRVTGQGRDWLLDSLEALRQRTDFVSLSLPDLLNHLVTAGRRVRVLYIHGHWLDVNRTEDLARASDFAHGSHRGAGGPPR